MKYDPLKVSSYLTLLKQLKAKQGCLNTQNNDEKCFLWSILPSFYPVQHNLHRVLNYEEYEHELNMSGMQYVVDIKDIGKLEHHNNISINV